MEGEAPCLCQIQGRAKGGVSRGVACCTPKGRGVDQFGQRALEVVPRKQFGEGERN